MPARFQLVVDCKDPEVLARFWAAALGYVLEPPPEVREQYPGHSARGPQQRVDAEARRLTDLGATLTVTMSADCLDHTS